MILYKLQIIKKNNKNKIKFNTNIKTNQIKNFYKHLGNIGHMHVTKVKVHGVTPHKQGWVSHT